ncbi:hypothetical protein D3C76_1443820 [compost metagenome]
MPLQADFLPADQVFPGHSVPGGQQHHEALDHRGQKKQAPGLSRTVCQQGKGEHHRGQPANKRFGPPVQPVYQPVRLKPAQNG